MDIDADLPSVVFQDKVDTTPFFSQTLADKPHIPTQWLRNAFARLGRRVLASGVDGWLNVDFDAVCLRHFPGQGLHDLVKASRYTYPMVPTDI